MPEPRKLEIVKQPIWEIQPTEGSKAYEAFKVYRDLGPKNRSLVSVGRILGLAQGKKGREGARFTEPGGSISGWCSRNGWVERVRAFDAYLDTKRLAQQEEELRDSARTWARRQEEVREREWALSAGLLEKVREMLKYPITRTTRTKQSRDGKQIYITTIEPARWDWKAAVDVLRYASTQARMSAEMVTDGGRAPTPDPTAMGSSDLDAWLGDIGAGAPEDAVPIEDA